jgi:putative transposase
MPRKPRNAPGGLVYHVLNRAAGRIMLFRNDADYLAFERVLLDAHERQPVEIFSYCTMPNHWHLVLRPRRDGDLTDFCRRLAHTHAMRWRVAHHTVGYGPLYQGRFKSFPIQCDHHLLTVLRYVERNARTANLVSRAADWRWCSLAARANPRDPLNAILSDWPVGRPRDWARIVDAPLTGKELDRLETSESRGRPFGDERWMHQMVSRLSLEHTMRREGRPRKSAPPNQGKSEVKK